MEQSILSRLVKIKNEYSNGDNDKIIADCVDIESVRPEKQELEYNAEDELNISIDENILQELVAF